MDIEAKNILLEIGSQLDQGIFPTVSDGGFVLPSESSVAITDLGKELDYEQGSRTRAPGIESQGQQPSEGASASQTWQAGGTPSVVGSGVADYRETLAKVEGAYPGVQMWDQGEGFWLLAGSSLLPGLPRSAIFLVGISTTKRLVKSWGFWQMGIGLSWIGPRHTNFPDGSVCAFEPRDSTWIFGQSLVNLLDIYSVWALRHLHLEMLGRWPGPQVANIPYEVDLEVKDIELCPCGSMKRYISCCKEAHRSRNLVADAIRYCLVTRGGSRCPPTTVLNFVRDQTQPPSIAFLVNHQQ